MKTFISYSSEASSTAGKIKEYLDKYGFCCFLAHEDIPAQTVWPKQIIEALKECTLFIPILTPEFSTSLFCQQEVGFAYCSTVEILPIMAPTPPMGMIADIQGLKYSKKNHDDSCWKIVDHIAKSETLCKEVIDSMIFQFGNSLTYDSANKWVTTLLSSSYHFTKDQILQIKEYIENKNQIYETKHARDEIFEFMKKYPKIFKNEFVEMYDRRSRIHMRRY
jgi:hypothetical protein